MAGDFVGVILGETAQLLPDGRVQILRVDVRGNLRLVRPVVDAVLTVSGALWTVVTVPVAAVGTSTSATARVPAATVIVASVSTSVATAAVFTATPVIPTSVTTATIITTSTSVTSIIPASVTAPTVITPAVAPPVASPASAVALRPTVTSVVGMSTVTAAAV